VLQRAASYGYAQRTAKHKYEGRQGNCVVEIKTAGTSLGVHVGTFMIASGLVFAPYLLVLKPFLKHLCHLYSRV
jgi:hypothetical protein